MQPLLLATTNKGKLYELRALLAPTGYEVIGLDEAASRVGSAPPDVEEAGSTFAQNARIKASAYANWSRLSTIGDDSGLCVDSLDGAPGIYSARYAGVRVAQSEHNDKLLNELRNKPAPWRAHFNCTIAYVAAGFCLPGGIVWTTEGRVDGVIVNPPRGITGFGYDPVFQPDEGDGRTFGEMSFEEKNRLSHRARALANLIKVLR